MCNSLSKSSNSSFVETTLLPSVAVLILRDPYCDSKGIESGRAATPSSLCIESKSTTTEKSWLMNVTKQ